MQFTIFQESRKGSRKVNQDRIAYTYGRDTLLLVVADGMGGHAGGEIAAQIAARLFVERFHQEAKPVLLDPLKFLQESLQRAHAALGSYAIQFSMLETPRTTCVACVVQAGFAYWAHVGTPGSTCSVRASSSCRTARRRCPARKECPGPLR